MRAGLCGLVGSALVLASLSAHAVPDGERLAKQNKCLACHQIDKRRVGPAYQSIASKYANQADAEQKLIQSIRQGSQKRWGAIPMPAQSHVSEQDARSLAAWILKLNP
ncbi:MAG: c-type cytochrome [Pigmentiphaga sp.]